MKCPYCNGSGVVDSGGVTPWGSGIDVPCSCKSIARTKLESALREYESKHKVWMNTVVFSDEAEQVKRDLDKARSDYDVARKEFEKA